MTQKWVKIDLFWVILGHIWTLFLTLFGHPGTPNGRWSKGGRLTLDLDPSKPVQTGFGPFWDPPFEGYMAKYPQQLIAFGPPLPKGGPKRLLILGSKYGSKSTYFGSKSTYFGSFGTPSGGSF